LPANQHFSGLLEKVADAALNFNRSAGRGHGFPLFSSPKDSRSKCAFG
jgi:hypothetical protein